MKFRPRCTRRMHRAVCSTALASTTMASTAPSRTATPTHKATPTPNRAIGNSFPNTSRTRTTDMSPGIGTSTVPHTHQSWTTTRMHSVTRPSWSMSTCRWRPRPRCMVTDVSRTACSSVGMGVRTRRARTRQNGWSSMSSTWGWITSRWCRIPSATPCGFSTTMNHDTPRPHDTLPTITATTSGLCSTTKSINTMPLWSTRRRWSMPRWSTMERWSTMAPNMQPCHPECPPECLEFLCLPGLHNPSSAMKSCLSMWKSTSRWRTPRRMQLYLAYQDTRCRASRGVLLLTRSSPPSPSTSTMPTS
mmetsp:Transcript_19649/g.42465  ORF Transcript_19649/g.42465 Transcript_19649/m.42465 type:complete len:304 (-) Transcript_19649:147-1058(-)